MWIDVSPLTRPRRPPNKNAGEPFDNFDRVTKALSVLTEQSGKLLLGPRKITVSTVGLVPQMERFLERGGGMLAVSLHATTDEVRKRSE